MTKGIEGIDVSAYQPERPDLDGQDFVIVKATEGRSYVNPRQEEQAATARAGGRVVGFYHFLWPGNIKEQARFFVEKCASELGDLLVCDWETTSDGTRASCSEKDAFLAEVQRLRPDRHRVLLYCNLDFWWHHDTTSGCADGLWIADPSAAAGHPRQQHPWTIHQYAVSGGYDRNVARFGSRAEMRAWADPKGHQAPPTKPSKPSKPAPPAPDVEKLHDVAGDLRDQATALEKWADAADAARD